MSKTIAITGASGFVGGAIARHFVEKGWRVIGFGRRAASIEGVDYQIWDIEEARENYPEPIDVLVHSAAKVDDFGDYAAFYQANVVGTQHVLQRFSSAGQFIFISSSSVYDPFAREKRNITEDFPYSAKYLNAYGETKMLAEKLLLAQRKDNLVILRPRAVYGIGDTTLLPRLMRAKRGRFLLGIGDGKNEISLTYIGNILHALDLVVERNFRQEIFNISDKETLHLDELLRLFAEHMNWDVQTLYIPQGLGNFLARVNELVYRGQPKLSRYSVHQLSSTYTLNIDKAIRMLCYAPPYSYREGFAEVQEWLRGKA
jgi:nucleoside-diphosphate-sugar epimerase